MTNSVQARRFISFVISPFLLVALSGCGNRNSANAPQEPTVQPTEIPTQTPGPPEDPAASSKRDGAVSSEATVPTTEPGKVIIVMPDDEDLAADIRASTPLSPKPKTIQVAGRTIKAQLCNIVGKQFLHHSSLSVFQAVEVSGDRLILIGRKSTLHGFKIGDDRLTLTVDRSFGDQGMLTLGENLHLDALDWANSRLIASGSAPYAYVIKDGKFKFDCQIAGEVSMHPSGKWGILSWVADVDRVEFADGKCKVEKMTLTSLHQSDPDETVFQLICSATIFDDGMAICGNVRVNEGDRKTAHRVVVFDHDGKEKCRFGNPSDPFADDGFSQVNAVHSSSAGLWLLDANLRRLSLRSHDGTLIASIDIDELFDLSYPWVPDFAVTDDGTAYFVAGQDREGFSVTEGVILRVTGL